ncbi:hypothetical protein [Agromyces sp. LHK192]|uniref:hypothetical protein n=1 Tax=Agromyces sp. LHK192 TaxID=2498704 RepID=UPI000FD985FF|nr:hypothetical protein [Agromyces sp. LHK192]
MSESKKPAARGAAFWICYAVVAIAALTGVAHTAGAIAAQGLGEEDALFGIARSIAILVLALIAPLFRSDDALLGAAVVLTIVLAIDAFVGAMNGLLWLTVWSAVLCLGTVIAATFLARSDRIRGRG